VTLFVTIYFLLYKTSCFLKSEKKRKMRILEYWLKVTLQSVVLLEEQLLPLLLCSPGSRAYMH